MLGNTDSWQPVLDLGKVLGALTVILLFAGLISRAKPTKWIIRQIVGDPISDWLDNRITKSTSEGIGSVLAGAVDAANENHSKLVEIKAAVEDLGTRTQDTFIQRTEDFNRLLQVGQEQLDSVKGDNKELRQDLKRLEDKVERFAEKVSGHDDLLEEIRADLRQIKEKLYSPSEEG